MTAESLVPEVYVITAQLFIVDDYVPAVGTEIVALWVKGRAVVVTRNSDRCVGHLPAQFDRYVKQAPAEDRYRGRVTSVQRGEDPIVIVQLSRD